MAETIIKTENLSYVYSEGTPYEHRAVDGVSIEIEKGSFVGLIGHTGSGKSSLIQHLNGLLKPTSGKIYFGELTFFAANGMAPFYPDEWDTVFGQWINLPKK